MSGFSEALDTTTEKYLVHFGKTAGALKEICADIGIPLDAAGVNAVAFTTYKATKDAFGHQPVAAQQNKPVMDKPATPSKASGEKGRIIKLENAGDEAYIAVSSCEKAEGNFGPQYEFRGALQPSGEAVRLFIGAAAVERQFEFIGASAETVSGKILAFSRAPNPKGKPFWNIKVTNIPAGKPSNDFTAAPKEDDSYPF